MLNRKLLEILKRLDAREIKRFRHFLQSPYFTYGLSNQEIIQLFEYIVRYGADVDAPQLEKRRVSTRLFPDKPYNENGKSPIDTLTSDLFRLTKKFLFVSEIERDSSEVMHELPVARFYRKCGLEERFWKSVQYMRSVSDSEQHQDERYFLERYFVEEEVHTFKTYFNATGDDANIGSKAYYLEQFFAIARMDTACLLNLQRRRVEFQDIYTQELGNDLIQLIREGVFHSNDLAEAYLLVFDAINNPNKPELVEQLRERLEVQKQHFPVAHLKNMMAYLRIFFMRKYQQSGLLSDFAEYFNLISKHLDEGFLYYDDKVLAPSLRNVVYNGLRLGYFDKVWEILQAHPPERIGGTRHPGDTYNLLIAVYYFALKDYENAEKHVAQCNFDDIHFNVQAEILYIKIYYETSNDLLDYRIKALQQKVRRSRMAKEFKERYFALLNKILLLVAYGWDKKNPKRAKLLEEVRSTPGLLEKDWLISHLE